MTPRWDFSSGSSCAPNPTPLAGGKFPAASLPRNGNRSLLRQVLLLEVVRALSGDDYLHLVLLVSSPKIRPVGPSTVVAVQP